jgi:hypothetical protein
MHITLCAYARATANERGTYTVMHKYYHNNFFVNKQNSNVQTREQGGSAACTQASNFPRIKQHMFIYGECDSHCPLLIIQGPAEIPDGF